MNFGRYFGPGTLGFIASHEIGHYLGASHTLELNDAHNVMDVGGPGELLASWIGIGPDGIYGSDDDFESASESTVMAIRCSKSPDGSPTRNDTLNAVAFGLSVGDGSTHSSATTTELSDDPFTAEIGSTAHMVSSAAEDAGIRSTGQLLDLVSDLPSRIQTVFTGRSYARLPMLPILWAGSASSATPEQGPLSSVMKRRDSNRFRTTLIDSLLEDIHLA